MDSSMTNGNGGGTIRSATLADARAIAALCAVLDLDVLPLGIADVAAYLDRGPLLVLDLGDGTIGAAAHVALEPAHGDLVHARLEFFAIHPALARNGAEDRMAAALLAICEESDCLDLDERSTGPLGRRTMKGR